MRLVTTPLILAILAPVIMAIDVEAELKKLPKFDPLDPADVAEFQERSRITARDLAAEQHGSVQAAATVYRGKLAAKNPETRGEALGELIALARDEDLPQIQEAFREGDPITVRKATDGIGTVIHDKLATSAFRAALLEVLVESLERGVDPTRMRLALQLDPRKPVAAILKHDVWRKDAHGLLELLRLFVEMRARVPLEKLRELAPQLPHGNDETAWWTYAAFLECYGLVAERSGTAGRQSAQGTSLSQARQSHRRLPGESVVHRPWSR